MALPAGTPARRLKMFDSELLLPAIADSFRKLPYALLKKVSGRIINEVRGINR
eukprot:gene15431-17649_t